MVYTKLELLELSKFVERAKSLHYICRGKIIIIVPELVLEKELVLLLVSETGEGGQGVGDSVHPDVPDLLGLRHQVQLPRVGLRLEDDGERSVVTEVLNPDLNVIHEIFHNTVPAIRKGHAISLQIHRFSIDSYLLRTSALSPALLNMSV